MDTTELEKTPDKNAEVVKGTPHIVVELIEYEHNAVVSKSIMKRVTGSVTAMSFDKGEGLNEKTSPFDTYAQIIDGSAIIVVNGKETKLATGEGMVIPAHKSNHVKPNGRFKMLLTVIKSGYENL
jgi:quercetin dioxygenase-like cupin family protein